MEFTLTNKPEYVKPQFESLGGKQRKMFAGMDCLPGQMDLFATDGPPEKNDEAEREVPSQVSK